MKAPQWFVSPLIVVMILSGFLSAKASEPDSPEAALTPTGSVTPTTALAEVAVYSSTVEPAALLVADEQVSQADTGRGSALKNAMVQAGPGRQYGQDGEILGGPFALGTMPTTDGDWWPMICHSLSTWQLLSSGCQVESSGPSTVGQALTGPELGWEPLLDEQMAWDTPPRWATPARIRQPATPKPSMSSPRLRQPSEPSVARLVEERVDAIAAAQEGALRSGTQDGCPDGAPLPLGARQGPPKLSLLVDQSRQMMYAYEDGVQVRVIPVSTGMPTSVTLTRAWKGVVGQDLGSGGVNGGMYADFKWYLFDDLYGRILIHSVPYIRQGDSKVYDNLDAVGVRPSSHGCVRITPEDAKWLREWGPVGAEIEITPWPGKVERVTGTSNR